MTTADAVSLLGHQIGWAYFSGLQWSQRNQVTYIGLLGIAFGLQGVLLEPVVGNVVERAPYQYIDRYGCVAGYRVYGIFHCFTQYTHYSCWCFFNLFLSQGV